MDPVAVRKSVRFWLNDDLVELHELTPTQNLLDFLRLQRRMCGTKEGCAEGDCGACTVLVGRLVDGILVYESVNACIRFTASLDGCHVVSIEHLQNRDGSLHPVQQAVVELHGSQCGFCSPGIVMSLYALWMNSPWADETQIEQALQGNLCRCTGYTPIVNAAKSVLQTGGQSADPLVGERTQIQARLEAMADGMRVEISGADGQLILPADVNDLAEVFAQNPGATIVAGATDVGLWVTKFMRDLGTVIFIGHLSELHTILEGDDGVTFGAGVTYSQIWPIILRHYPQMEDFWMRIGGQQVRNMGTIGGNIANGSPIGDTPPALISLGAAITLNQNGTRRFVRLEDYFVAYGKQDRNPGEFVESISVPFLEPEDHFAVYKISKRRDEDISTLCGAFRLRLDEKNHVEEIIVVFGGMAATPKRASEVEKSLLGSAWNEANVDLAMEAFEADYSPLSDVRGSASYRLLSAKNLLRRFFMETQGQLAELKRGTA